MGTLLMMLFLPAIRHTMEAFDLCSYRRVNPVQE